MTSAKPINIAILAMGGEGGGVLTDWINWDWIFFIREEVASRQLSSWGSDGSAAGAGSELFDSSGLSASAVICLPSVNETIPSFRQSSSTSASTAIRDMDNAPD